MTIAVSRIIHTIHATDSIDPIRHRYLEKLGGLTFAEGYHAAEDRDMALLYVADHMIEPMCPRDPSREDKAMAKYLRQYGPGWHSFEIKIDNAREAAAELQASGCKLATVYDIFFFVRPESTGGILLEVCEIPMRNDPYDRPNWNPDWAAGLPSGLTRFDHIGCVVADVEIALDFFTVKLDGRIVSDERITNPQPGRKVTIHLGDTKVAFVQPDDSSTGPLGAFLSRVNSGIYAMTWQVEDLAKARAWFESEGLRTIDEGCYTDGFAIHPDDFFGGRIEFVQR